MVCNPYNPYSDSYLAHYGVKGMKWGVRRQRRRAAARKDRNAWRSMSKKERKANRDKYNKRYSKDDRDADKATYGSGGVKRINRRMNKGQSYARAYFYFCGVPFDNAGCNAFIWRVVGAGERAIFMDRVFLLGDASLYGIVFGGYGFDSRRQYSGCHF